MLQFLFIPDLKYVLKVTSQNKMGISYITGFISAETTFLHLINEQKKEGLGWLKTKYSTANDEHKISCVVFVCSCMMGVPHDLIKCVRDVIEEVDPNTSRRKCKLIVIFIFSLLVIK